MSTDASNGEESGWNKDIELQPSLSKSRAPKPSKGSDGLVIALTGATGFLGKKLLQQLVQIPQIATIYCIAVRQPQSLFFISASTPKIVVYEGELTLPNVGLSNEDARLVFSRADIIIHNGAKVSFAEPYGAMRKENVESTRELVRLSLEHGHLSQFHFLSTSGLSTVLGQDIYEEPACSTPPAGPTAQGYIFTKLACELYLEEVSKKSGLHVTIYRPTIIIGPDAPRLDVMHSVLHYSSKISAVPQLTALDGVLQFVEVNQVAEAIVSEIIQNLAQRAPVEYRNLSGEDVEIDQLGSFVLKRSGVDVSSIPLTEWIEKARKAGLAPEIAGFLGAVHARGQKLKLNRLCKGTSH